MKAKLKNGLILFLTALLALSCAILLYGNNQTVFADTQIENDGNLTDKLVTSDEHFAYNGTTVDPELFEQGKYELGFRFDGVGTKWRDLSDYLPKTYKHPLMSTSFVFGSTATYKFKIFRDNADGKTKTALGEYIVFFKTGYKISGQDAMFKAIYYKNLTYCNETFTVPESLNFYDFPDCKIGDAKSTEYAKYYFKDYDVISAGIVLNSGIYDSLFPQDKTGIPYCTFGINTESAIQNYSIEFTHIEKIGDSVKYLPFKGYYDTTFTTTESTISSPSRSVKIYLTDWREQDEEGFAEFWENKYSEEVLQNANSIIDNVIEKEVTVKYLVAIDGTPFSTDTYHKVTVKVANGVITIPDILAEIDADTFICNGSFVEGLELDNKGTPLNEDDDVYVVKYLTDSWLRAVTVDGTYCDYFSDINLSYYAYYHGYVEKGVIRQEVYEYILSAICREYPVIGEKYSTTPERIYGKWGMAILPESYTINQLWTEMFASKATHGEQVCHFSWESTIAQSEYDALMAQYEYGWLQRAWNNVVGAIDGHRATYYLFYTDPETTISWVDQRGDVKNEEDLEDPNQDGALSGDIQEGTGKLKQAWDSFLGFVDGLTGTSFSLAGVAIVAVLGFIVYKYFFRSGGTKKKRK